MSSVSSGGPKTARVTAPVEWDRLELAVRRLLDEYAACRRRAEAAERRVVELEAAMHEVGVGAVDPFDLHERIAALDDEDASLRERRALEIAGVGRDDATHYVGGVAYSCG